MQIVLFTMVALFNVIIFSGIFYTRESFHPLYSRPVMNVSAVNQAGIDSACKNVSQWDLPFDLQLMHPLLCPSYAFTMWKALFLLTAFHLHLPFACKTALVIIHLLHFLCDYLTNEVKGQDWLLLQKTSFIYHSIDWCKSHQCLWDSCEHKGMRIGHYEFSIRAEIQIFLF